MKKNKFKIIVGIITCLILAVSFFMGDNIPETAEKEVALNVIHTEQPTEIPKVTAEPVKSEQPAEENSVFSEQPTVTEKSEVKNIADSVPAITEQPAETPTDTADLLTCTLSVNCKSVLDNYEMLKDGKKEIIPRDGVIFKEKTVEFFADESVFDVMLREMKNSKIQFEFVNTPMYNSVYIEGIGNLYEFDCGDYSGWMYKVNGIKPTYSCSQYKVKNGDKIEFFYSCNFMNETK